MYQFKKAAVPTEESEKVTFLEKLLKFGVSVKQYESAYALEDGTMYVILNCCAWYVIRWSSH